MSILIRNADWIVTMDRERRIIRNGAVAIEEDRIIDLGKTVDVGRRCKADTVIDAKDKIVLPGLIDGHIHNSQQLARGIADDVTAQEWLYDRIFPFESSMTDDDAYWSALACQLEMIRAGTTCFIDFGSYFPNQTAKATGETGMRGIVSRSTLDVWKTGKIGGDAKHKMVPKARFQESTEQALKEGEEVVRRWNGSFDDRVRAWFQLRVPSNVTDELCTKTKELADRYGVGFQTHAAWNKETRDQRSITRFHRLGILSPNLLLIHMGWADFQEILLLREHNVKVTHCPGGGGHLSHGATAFGRFPEMLDLGIAVCLGSDAAPNGNFLDVVRLMYLASCGYKDARLDANIMSPERVIEMATLNGAKAALWEDDIGSIEVGKKADISIFTTRRPEWRPVINPIANLVYAATGNSAHTVIVDGKILMEDGRVNTIDEQEVLDQVQKHAEECLHRAGLEDIVGPKWPIE